MGRRRITKGAAGRATLMKAGEHTNAIHDDDDDDDTRETCAAALTALGADVRTARSAATGLGVLGQFSAQVILCDLAMPGEDGYAFILALRRDTSGANIPAAAVSALASAEDRRRALESGFQLHLAKPVAATRLAGAVATLVAPPPAVPPATDDPG